MSKFEIEHESQKKTRRWLRAQAFELIIGAVILLCVVNYVAA
ncbi:MULTISPECIES: hypothetical protein [Roseobacteraceae]|nr:MULTISPECIES: hypothetical protein [Roseobacteraceae]